jgi:hypothetical protein
MKPVLEKLLALEIPPAGDSRELEPVGVTSHELIDRVIRRAEDLRRSWSESNGASYRSSARASAAASV